MLIIITCIIYFLLFPFNLELPVYKLNSYVMLLIDKNACNFCIVIKVIDHS